MERADNGTSKPKLLQSILLTSALMAKTSSSTINTFIFFLRQNLLFIMIQKPTRKSRAFIVR